MTYKFKCGNCKKVFNKKMLKGLEIDNDFFICDNCDYRFIETDILNLRKEDLEYDEKEETIKELRKNNLTIPLPVYYSEDDEGNIKIDDESIENDLQDKLNELKELVE